MSDEALVKFKEAREKRRGLNDARRIRGERDKAQSPTSGAGRRWPFELLQNAHDPGPRTGSAQVNVEFDGSGSGTVFQHDGQPFSMNDLAALLSGGSNKEYETKESTGRYGTGFLVTHALSSQINLRGVVNNGESIESFSIHLDRAGDEKAILDNANKADDDIKNAQAIESMDGIWTAEFEYPNSNLHMAEFGIEEVRKVAPYLYGTCQHLGRTSIKCGHWEESWIPRDTKQGQIDGANYRERIVQRETESGKETFRVIRLSSRNQPEMGIVFLLKQFGSNWGFVSPLPELRRVFFRFPVRGASFLPINCIIDGQLDVQVERDRLAMNEADKTNLAAALSLIPKAMQLGVNENWQRRHWLARVAKVTNGFSGRKLDRRQPSVTWIHFRDGGRRRREPRPEIAASNQRVFNCPRHNKKDHGSDQVMAQKRSAVLKDLQRIQNLK